MAPPTAYTESSLKAYMHTDIAGMSGVLGWSVADGDYDEAVNDALILYGVSDIAAATDVRRLRLLAAVAVWRRVVSALANLHDFSADGGSYSANQLYTNAQARVRDIESQAAAYLPEYAAVVQSVEYQHDPYGVTPYDERTL